MLLGVGAAGIPFATWPPKRESDDEDDEDASDDDEPRHLARAGPRLDAPFERPKLAAREFEGKAGEAAFASSKRGGRAVAAAGLALVAPPKHRGLARRGFVAFRGPERHAVPARAVKAVREANVEELAKLKDKHGPFFLRNLRVAKGWTLAHVAATVGNGAMLPALDALGVPLDVGSDLGDTVAHVAAYHGCVGALRVLKARGVSINAENDAGERPAHKAVLRGHDNCVAWFKRRRVAIPRRARAVEEDWESGFAPRARSAQPARGPRPEIDPGTFLEGFF